MALDFSLLGQGPQFGNVLAAFQGGQQARRDTDTRNALSRYSTDPEGAISALSKVDPVLSMKLRDDMASRQAAAQKRAVFQETDPAKQDQLAAASGDPETQKTLMELRKGVMDMDAAKREELTAKNEAAGSTYYSLLKIPKEQRAAAYQQVRPYLAEIGAPDFDPMDDNLLQTKVMQAQSVDKIISQAQADEKAKRDAENLRIDNERADMLANNTIQTDQARLGIDRQRLGLEGQRVAIARQNAASGGGEGGGGRAPSGYRWGANGALEFIPGGPADPATKGASLRVIPQKVASGLAGNRTSLDKIDRALGLVDKYPKGLGLANKLGDDIRQRTDPNGVEVRAAIADIGSQKLHDRSGAAVTVGEAPRLMPFIPKVDDTPETAKKKLRMLRYEYESMINETEQLYAEDNGYRPSGQPRGAAPAAAAKPATRPPLSAIFGK